MKSVLGWFCSNLSVFIAIAFLAGAIVLFSGCYTLKEGTTMLGYLGRAIPLEELAGKETASDEDRNFVKRVEDIRRFAIEELGLKESKNYTRFVILDRDYLAAVVSASAKDSFTTYEWWFPVVGKVPYKGFFDAKDARNERAKLEKKDLDVWIRGVDAFSTLGWFRDPLYSYMEKYSDRELAELIIHELLHATVYLKNNSQFNEQLAEFVGSEGARLYIEKKRANSAEHSTTGGSGAADVPGRQGDDANGDNTKADNAAYLTFIRGLIVELDDVYKSDIPRDEKLKHKDEIIDSAKKKFDADYDTLFKTERYRGFSKLPVNNAYLGLYRLYYEEDNFFKDLYEKTGRNLPKLIAAAKTLKGRGDPKAELLAKF